MAFSQEPAAGAPGGTGSAAVPKRVAVPNDTQDPVAARPLSDQDRAFLETAAARSSTAVAMARLALQRSSDPEVRSLAEMELSEHSRMLGELRQVAERKELSLGPEFTAEQRGNVLGLHLLRGEEFDRAYMTAVRDHQKEAIERYEEQRDGGSNILVRSYAAKNYLALKRLAEEEKPSKAE
jgi:putative membrane protein